MITLIKEIIDILKTIPQDFRDMWSDILRDKTTLGKIFIGYPLCILTTFAGVVMILGLPLMIFIYSIGGLVERINLSPLRNLFYKK